MPYNGSGVFSLVAGNPVVTGTVISSTVQNNTMSDIASNGLTNCLTKDGQTTPTANLPMGNFRLTNLGSATAGGDAVNATEVQNGTLITLASVTGTDTIAGSTTPNISAYALGQRFQFVPVGANTTNAVTLNVSGLGAKSVTKNGANALQPGDIPNAIAVVEVVYDGTQFQIASVIPALSAAPVVGSVRNARMSVAAASTSGTFTADEVVVETALGGIPYRLSAYSQVINISTTGAGGMDTGTAPVNGFVALYAIYNPTAGTTSILATNASTLQGNVYGGTHMPSGYTASALIGVWPTNASSQFQLGLIADRNFYTGANTTLNTNTQQASLTSLSVAGNVPLNAKTIIGGYNLGSSSITNTTGSIASSATGISGVGINGLVAAPGESIGGPFTPIPLITPQTIFYSCSVGAGTMTFTISISGYTF